MTLILRGLSRDEEPLSVPLVGRFDDRGGEIGRSDNATFTLPDPERLISRLHARITHADHRYWVENISAGTMLHNGRPLSSGMRVSLGDGDEIRIGGYRLSVAFEDDEASATILRGRTTPAHMLLPPSVKPAPPPAPSPPPPPAPPAAARPVAVLGAAPQPEPERPKPAPPRPPAPVPPPPMATPPAPSRGAKPGRARSGGSPSSPDALWRGFQEGAGVDLPLPTDPSPELFSAIGAMLRIAVGGLHRLIAMRAVSKEEMHADRTMIQVRGNNPLKFSPDVSVALKLLLQPPATGFLSGPAALHDAVIDLQSHQVGVMAGMRAALAAVLEHFDPARIENKLQSRSVIDSLVPAHRRARLWELYLEHNRVLREEAEEDFGRFFGEAFREAYDAQVRSLEAASAAAAHPPMPPRSGPAGG